MIMGAKMSFFENRVGLDIENTHISYSKWGKGDSILFLHGNPGSRKDFQNIIPMLKDEGCQCVVPDRPGHFSSSDFIEQNDSGWSDTEIYAQLIDQVCGGRTVLVGYSMGAFIACKIAVKYPDKVKAIAMLAPYVDSVGSKKTSSIPKIAQRQIPGTVLAVLLPFLSQSKIEKHLNNQFAPEIIDQEFLEDMLPKYCRFENIISTIKDKNAMIDTLQEVQEKMSQISCPVSVLAGEKDAVCDANEQVDFIKKAITNSNVKMLENSGHAIPYQNPEDCTQTIKDLLKKLT